MVLVFMQKVNAPAEVGESAPLAGLARLPTPSARAEAEAASHSRRESVV